MSAQDDAFASALRVSHALDPARESDAMFGRIIGAVFEGDEVPAGSIVLRIAVPEWTRVAAWNVTVLPEYMSDEAKAEAIQVRFA